jgi:hypothetical protein
VRHEGDVWHGLAQGFQLLAGQVFASQLECLFDKQLGRPYVELHAIDVIDVALVHKKSRAACRQSKRDQQAENVL